MEANRIDLHLHSTFSDGLLSVEEMIGACKQAGLAVVAITDHDTVDQVASALEAGRKAGIRVVPGIELSVGHGEYDFHLLAYNFDPANAALAAALADQAQARRDRVHAIQARLADAGYLFDPQPLLAKAEGSVGRPEIARAVLANPANADRLRQETIEDYSTFLDRYLTTGQPGYVERRRLAMTDAIRLITEAGGVTSWAHAPWNLRRQADAEIRRRTLAEEFRAAGLAGLEVFYPTHSREQTKQFLRLCRELDLAPTAGSDYHGPGRENLFPRVGAWQDFGLDWQPDQRFL